jgi:regulator of cell morphogenesis and NO signaling
MQEPTAESNLDENVGEIVAADFRTARVFDDHGIDYSYEGKSTLAKACSEKGINLDAISRELERVKSEPVKQHQKYASWHIPFLIDYIFNVHHAYLKGNMEQLAADVRKIASVHGDHHPEVIQIATIFDKIALDLTAHMEEEDNRLFPALRRADAEKTTGSTPATDDQVTIRVCIFKFYHEHEEIGAAVHSIRKLSTGYTIPDGVCSTFRDTYRNLKEFENDLHKHVHLENNILFPKAALL